MRTGFRTQLALLLGTVVATLVVTILLTTNVLISRKVATDQGEALQALAQSTSAMLSEGLHERMREIELLASSPDVRDHIADAARITGILNRVQQSHPQYSWLGFATSDGVVRMSAQDILVGKDVGSRPWYQQGQRRAYVGDIHEAKLLAKILGPAANGEPLRFVDFASPVIGPKGQVIGVLGAHENWDWVRGVIATLRSTRAQDKGIEVFVLDHSGNIIQRPDGASGRIEPLDHKLLPLDHGFVNWSDTQPYMTATAPLVHADSRVLLGWTVVVRQPKDMAMHAATTSRHTILVVGLSATALAMLLAWWVAGYLSRPLQRISQAAKQIEAGELSVHLPALASSRELQDVTTSLRSMTDALLHQQHALEEANATLEARVDERTIELQRANDELVMLARKDALTGLFNRRAAEDRMHEESARHRRSGNCLGLLMIDIDFFKRINDQFGHAAGDEALKHVSHCLSLHCRGTDFIARIGGEEFLVLLPETRLPGAMQLADKLRSAVEQLDVPSVGRVSISVGVAEFGRGPLTIEQTLAHADKALYEAKEAGRNRVVAHDEFATGHSTALIA